MLTYIKRLTDERDSLTATATGITETAAREERDVTETERASLAQMATRCAAIDEQLTTYNAQAESQRAYAQLRAAATADHEDDGETLHGEILPRARAAVATVEESWLAPITRSAEFASYSGHGTSARVECGSVFEERATILSTDVPQPHYKWTGNGQSPMVIAPLAAACGYQRVPGGAVDYAYITPSPATAAPVVPENTAKPEMTFTINPKSETLQTYAHWKAMTRQALDDVPGLEALVRGQLQAGLQMAIENGIAAAIGAEANWPTASGSTMLGAARTGIATLQSAGKVANALLLNPLDWADIDLAILAGTLAGPVSNSSPWGVKIVASPQVPAGTGYVGDFKSAVTVFDRGVSSVYMTDSHASNFLSNVLVILAETRALPAVTDATALCELSVVTVP
jgi:hypothetical protein